MVLPAVHFTGVGTGIEGVRMISVIIPTLNEASRLEALLGVLAEEALDHETIVVDGGSRDGTVEIARRAGVRLLCSHRGRGRQLAAGARTARGEIFFFLHADTALPAGALGAIAGRLGTAPEIVGGNFHLLFDGNDDLSRWLEGFYAWIRRRGDYYGDSGVFLRRAVFEALGGIRPIALMEDYDLIRRLESFGPTICIEDPPLETSSRRFHGRRRGEIVWGWLKIHALFHLGVSPDRLARLYNSARD